MPDGLGGERDPDLEQSMLLFPDILDPPTISERT
jgi:hypothetical protein